MHSIRKIKLFFYSLLLGIAMTIAKGGQISAQNGTSFKDVQYFRAESCTDSCSYKK